MLPLKKTNSRGFTLLEILLVVGIIAILAGIVIVAINPARQLARVRNTERQSDVKQIDSAITQYYIKNGSYPGNLSTFATLTEICDTGEESNVDDSECTGLVNLSELVPDYLTAIPTDPSADEGNTEYTVMRGARLTTVAPLTELETYAIAIGTTTVLATGAVEGGGGGGGCDATCLALREGLLGYWPFDDDASDNSGNGNDADVNGASSGAAGKVGNAYSYNGSGDYIELPIDLNPHLDITLAGWFKTSNTADGEMVIIANDNNTYGRGFQAQSSGGTKNFQAWYEPGGYFSSSNFDYATDNWVHFAVVYEQGVSAKLYINGSVVGTGGTESSPSDASVVRLGRALSGRYFTGEIDEVGIWERALSSTEIGQLRNGGSGRSLFLE